MCVCVGYGVWSKCKTTQKQGKWDERERRGILTKQREEMPAVKMKAFNGISSMVKGHTLHSMKNLLSLSLTPPIQAHVNICIERERERVH